MILLLFKVLFLPEEQKLVSAIGTILRRSGKKGMGIYSPAVCMSTLDVHPLDLTDSVRSLFVKEPGRFPFLLHGINEFCRCSND